MLKPSEIIFKDRIRSEYGDINALSESLIRSAQISPVTVKRENGNYILVDGGRRLKALQIHNNDNQIPCYIMDSELSAKELEAETVIHTKEHIASEIYEAGKIKEIKYRRQVSSDEPEPTQEIINDKVAKDFGKSKTTYKRIKKVFNPENEEEIGKEKHEEIKKIADNKSPAAAANALNKAKAEIADTKFKEEYKKDPSAIEAKLNTEKYLEKLKQAMSLIREQPELITENGFERFKKYWLKIIKELEGCLNETQEESRSITYTAPA